MKRRVAVFASGRGSNTENLISYFKNHPQIEVVLVLSNSNKAEVLQKATKHGIETYIFTKQALNNEDSVLKKLRTCKIDFIVLAGFLLKMPVSILHAFPDKVLNIHPALLPKYGGKGMYGMHVHHAVVENKEKETGITIHYVNEHYDEGAIVFQVKTSVSPIDTPETVAEKIYHLEQEHLPKVVEQLILETDGKK